MAKKECKHKDGTCSAFETRSGGYEECNLCGAVRLGRRWGELSGSVHSSLTDAKAAAATAAAKDV